MSQHYPTCPACGEKELITEQAPNEYKCNSCGMEFES